MSIGTENSTKLHNSHRGQRVRKLDPDPPPPPPIRTPRRFQHPLAKGARGRKGNRPEAGGLEGCRRGAEPVTSQGQDVP